MCGADVAKYCGLSAIDRVVSKLFPGVAVAVVAVGSVVVAFVVTVVVAVVAVGSVMVALVVTIVVDDVVVITIVLLSSSSVPSLWFELLSSLKVGRSSGSNCG